MTHTLSGADPHPTDSPPSQPLPVDPAASRCAPLSCPTPIIRGPWRDRLIDRKLALTTKTWQRLQREGQALGLPTSTYLRQRIEAMLGPDNSADVAPPEPPGQRASLRVWLHPNELAAIKALADGLHRKPHALVHELLALGLDYRKQRLAIPATKADELRHDIEVLEAQIDQLGCLAATSYHVLLYLAERLLQNGQTTIDDLHAAASQAGQEHWHQQTEAAGEPATEGEP